ncbi:MAG: DUF3545 family protein [Ruminobacter sp.]|jgi:hypothetical protein|nr:DUF3545 family protein [Ruminobacter sp.]
MATNNVTEAKAVETTDEILLEDGKSDKKDKKSRWRDIERLKQKLALIKALKDIDPDYDVRNADEFMEF